MIVRRLLFGVELSSLIAHKNTRADWLQAEIATTTTHHRIIIVKYEVGIRNWRRRRRRRRNKPKIHNEISNWIMKQHEHAVPTLDIRLAVKLISIVRFPNLNAVEFSRTQTRISKAWAWAVYPSRVHNFGQSKQHTHTHIWRSSTWQRTGPTRPRQISNNREIRKKSIFAHCLNMNAVVGCALCAVRVGSSVFETMDYMRMPKTLWMSVFFSSRNAWQVLIAMAFEW